MNATLTRALIIAVPVGALLVGSAVAFVRRRTLAALLSMLGAACLGLVILVHVAEGMNWDARMGWGQSTSAGHYLDLASAAVGLTLLLAAFIAKIMLRSRRAGSRPGAPM